jgi:ubiquinone/menaquinone biosynthesis C-methylase UbiE
MCKSCELQGKSAKSRRVPRYAALAFLIVGVVISIHLLAIRVIYWWLPAVVALVPAHALILAGFAWIITRLRHNHSDSGGHAGDSSDGHSHVLHNPRAYDWLARTITLGGEGRFRRRTVDLAELKSGDAVLDVGCGTGTLLMEAAKRIGPSGVLHGVDRSPEMLAHARRKVDAQGIRAEFREGSSDRLTFAESSFDVVFCTLMLHHLPASMQVATVAEMRRVLRPGGRMIIVDMQRAEKVSAAFSHIGLFHLFQSRATLPDWQRIEELLAQLGVELAARRAIWGESVCALVGRMAAQT